MVQRYIDKTIQRRIAKKHQLQHQWTTVIRSLAWVLPTSPRLECLLYVQGGDTVFAGSRVPGIGYVVADVMFDVSDQSVIVVPFSDVVQFARRHV